MKTRILVCLLCIVASISSTHAKNFSQTFDKTAFYKVFAGNDLAAVDNQLAVLKNISIAQKDAYEGALLMKKAGLIAGMKKKLNTFKEGHKKLEAVIEKDNSNAELRFLRLLIQENAPKILGYSGEREEDAKVIKASFKNLAAPVQQAISDYSKKSKMLKPQDFNSPAA